MHIIWLNVFDSVVLHSGAILLGITSLHRCTPYFGGVEMPHPGFEPEGVQASCISQGSERYLYL